MLSFKIIKSKEKISKCQHQNVSVAFFYEFKDDDDILETRGHGVNGTQLLTGCPRLIGNCARSCACVCVSEACRLPSFGEGPPSRPS